MTTESPKSSAGLAMVIVVAALIVGAVTYLAVSPAGETTTTVCVVAVPPPQGIYLRVINDSGSPIAGLQVTIQSTANASCDSKDVQLTDSIAVTNSTGWLLFQGWLYYFVFSYSGATYNFTVGGDPMAWTIATVSVPSGILTTEVCGLGGSSLTSYCQAASTTTISSASTTSSSCSGYPPGGDCLATYDYTFTISVNYTGSWKLTYQGYNNLGESNPTGVSGSYNGTGFYSKAVTLSSVDTGGLTLCATAQKLDGSNSTLILTVTGYNETSLPSGSVTYCGGVVP